MKSSRTNKNSSSFPYTLLLSIYGIVCAVFVIIVFVSRRSDVPLQNFTGDPAYILNGHPFVGVISNIGILLWCSAACICLFSFFVYKNSWNTKRRLFLFCSGMVSLMLLVDDLFMLHEFVVPLYFNLTEEYLYVIYLLIMVSWGCYFWNEIWDSEYKILGIAVVFLGGSVLGDLIFPSTELGYLLEDALKFVGIVTWFIYFARHSYYSLSNNLETG